MNHAEFILAHQIAAKVAEEPGRDVVTFENPEGPDEIRTYQDLWDNGRRVAKGLIVEGMNKGDSFGLLMQNHPEFIDTMVGSSIVGTVFVPIDPRTKGDKLEYMLRHAECRGIVCGDYSLAAVVELLERLPRLEWIWVLGSSATAGPGAAGRRVRNFTTVLSGPVPEVGIQVNDANDPMEIMYTSGTTGDPKGVVVRYVRWGTVGSWAPVLGFKREDRPYTGLSLTHGNAQLVTLASGLRLGMREVFSRKFTKSRLWDISRKYGCTVFNLLGGMTTAIYSEPARPDDADNPVRFVVSAGMPAAIWKDFEKRFDLKVMEFYGAVEGGLTINPIGVGPVGSIGKPPPSVKVRIVDENEQDVKPFAHGEIIFQPVDGTPPVVDYFKNPEASAKKTRGGWLRMGDIGHFDNEGWMYFDYRVGGGIRHNGDFVNTAFVEKAIAENPAVTDVFVYGVPAASGSPGEKDVVAAIVPEKGVQLDPAALFAWCRQKLEPNFVPSYLQVVDEIPKTASEKPLERFLFEAFAPDAANVHRA